MRWSGFQEMEKKNSQRLTAVEKNQAETQRMLGDVMKSNMNIQTMLQSFITNFSSSDATEAAKLPRTNSTKPGDSMSGDLNPPATTVGNSSGIGSSERWWDRLCKTSEEEDEGDVTKKRSNLKAKSLLQEVSTAYCLVIFLQI